MKKKKKKKKEKEVNKTTSRLIKAIFLAFSNMKEMLLVLLALVGELSGALEIREIPSSGIYFEELEPMKFIRDSWRVTIVLNYTPERYNWPFLEGCFERFQQGDLVGEEEQTEIIKLQQDFARAREKYEEISDLYERADTSITREEREWLAHQADSFRHRDDGFVINKETKLLVIESSLSRLSAENREDIRDLMLDINRARNPLADQFQQRAALKRGIHLMRQRMDRLLANGTEIVRALLDLRNQTVRDTLVDAGNMRSIIRRLNKEAGYQFPSAERLSDLVITGSRFGTLENKAFIELSLPLVGNETYLLYKVNTLPVTQQRANIVVGMANIRPRDDYVITEYKEHYYSLTQEEMDKCFRTANQTLCPAKWFMLREAAPCENSLLKDGKDASFRECDIQFVKGYRPTIRKLAGSDEWIYSVNKTTILKVSCNGTSTEEILNGTGVLGFDQECTLSLGGEKFPSGRSSKSPGNRLVLPKKALNIWEIVPLTPEMSEVFMQWTDPGAAWNFWEVAQRSQAQIREQVRGERHWIYLIILTIVLLLTLAGVLGLLYFLCYFKFVLSHIEDDSEEGIIREPRIDDHIV